MIFVRIQFELIICLFVAELSTPTMNSDTKSRLLELVTRRERRSGHGGATAERDLKKTVIDSGDRNCDKDQMEIEELNRLMESLSVKLAELRGRIQIKKNERQPENIINNFNPLTTPNPAEMDIPAVLVPRCVEGNNTATWDAWREWSPCSVTCGKGRQIRWRQCKAAICIADTEMAEKSCQMPACSPSNKLFSFLIPRPNNN